MTHAQRSKLIGRHGALANRKVSSISRSASRIDGCSKFQALGIWNRAASIPFGDPKKTVLAKDRFYLKDFDEARLRGRV
jgi:hypothetical protein